VSEYDTSLLGLNMNHPDTSNFDVLYEFGRLLYHVYTSLLFVTISSIFGLVVTSLAIIVGSDSTEQSDHVKVFCIAQL